MASWISLAVLSALAVSTTSLPDGAYNIPRVGTGRRSQYFVLHNDGTYKHGHDTGKGAFESARSSRVGQQDGQFGYVDPEGNSVNLQYQAGEGGFVARGTHLPEPHPDFYAAHAEANSRPPFVDPLANPNVDASYGFQFAGEGQTRSEQADADGNIRGSYSFTDENGQTRTYSYTAGRDTGFVVESNDLPVAPGALNTPGSTPAATRQSSSSGFSTSSYRAPQPLRTTSSRNVVSSYRAPSVSRPASVNQRFSGHHQSSSIGSQSYSGPVSSSVQVPFEVANTRSVQNNDGSYAFAYGTSSHSHEESSDRNNNVDGDFAFVADDGQRREIKYEAGSNTGFIAEGSHIPVGPVVPGAPSGQPTGRIVPVREVIFVDPLANSNADASYDFAFQSDEHSRSETADSDGNVQGTYTVTDEDGTKRTIRYRAGKGIGFETEEIFSTRGAASATPSVPIPSRHYSLPSSSPRVSATHGAASTHFTGSPSVAAHSRGVTRQSSNINRQSVSTLYSAPSAVRSASSSSDFQLRQYDAAENPNKFGYVLTFGN